MKPSDGFAEVLTEADSCPGGEVWCEPPTERPIPPAKATSDERPGGA